MSIKVLVSLETDWNTVSKRKCPLSALRIPKLVSLATTSLFVLGIIEQNVGVAVCGSIKRYKVKCKSLSGINPMLPLCVHGRHHSNEEGQTLLIPLEYRNQEERPTIEVDHCHLLLTGKTPSAAEMPFTAEAGTCPVYH